MVPTGDRRGEEAFVDKLILAIGERDQLGATDLFFRMVTRDGRLLSDALGAVAAAEAPFVPWWCRHRATGRSCGIPTRRRSPPREPSRNGSTRT
jgi:hypothetical protein